MGRQAVLDWFDGDEAVRRARKVVADRKLPAVLADDVMQEARIRILTHVEPDAAIDNPAAFGMRTIQYAIADLHRAIRRRPVETLDADVAGASPDLPVALLADDVRRALARRIAPRPWVAAAALAQTTFLLHGDVALPVDAPTTDGTDRQIEWAALWLAGEYGCFPLDGATEDAAMRVRRSRAITSVQQHLAEVVAAIGADA